jgi:hypothetical protein
MNSEKSSIAVEKPTPDRSLGITSKLYLFRYINVVIDRLREDIHIKKLIEHIWLARLWAKIGYTYWKNASHICAITPKGLVNLELP